MKFPEPTEDERALWDEIVRHTINSSDFNCVEMITEWADNIIKARREAFDLLETPRS